MRCRVLLDSACFGRVQVKTDLHINQPWEENMFVFVPRNRKAAEQKGQLL